MRFLTIRQVADRLRVSPGLVYALIKRGDLHAVLVGKHLCVTETELAAYLERSATQ